MCGPKAQLVVAVEQPHPAKVEAVWCYEVLVKTVAYQVAVKKVMEKAATAARWAAKEVAKLRDKKFLLPNIDEPPSFQFKEWTLKYAKEKVESVCFPLEKSY